jgi:hypothetical protein
MALTSSWVNSSTWVVFGFGAALPFIASITPSSASAQVQNDRQTRSQVLTVRWLMKLQELLG